VDDRFVSATFPRQVRLTEARDFQQVFAVATRVAGAYLVLLYRENSLGHARLGLAISGKHVKTAVARNRIKRRIRETFRLQRQQLANVDIIILSRAAAEKADNTQIQRCLDWLWQKLKEQCAT
jgi:ribonuclease P protein component